MVKNKRMKKKKKRKNKYLKFDQELIRFSYELQKKYNMTVVWVGSIDPMFYDEQIMATGEAGLTFRVKNEDA